MDFSLQRSAIDDCIWCGNGVVQTITDNPDEGRQPDAPPVVLRDVSGRYVMKRYRSHVEMAGRRQVQAMPGTEQAEAGSQSTPGLRRVLASADEAADKVPSAAAGPSGSAAQQLLAEDQVEEIPSSSGAATEQER